MSRLTEQDEQGNWGVKGIPWKDLYEGNLITKKIREKLYGCLAKLKDYENTGLSPQQVEKLMDKDVPGINAGSKWIPVSERLPNRYEYQKNDGRFIVTDGNRTYQNFYDIYNGQFRSTRRIDKCVIAWMPLPEPYKEV